MTVLKTKVEHISISKSFLILFLLGVYFFSVTPPHAYVHSLLKNSHKIEKSKSEHNNSSEQKTCNYYKYVANGLGYALVNNVQSLGEKIEYQIYQSLLIDNYNIFFKDYILDLKSLRAPPFCA